MKIVADTIPPTISAARLKRHAVKQRIIRIAPGRQANLLGAMLIDSDSYVAGQYVVSQSPQGEEFLVRHLARYTASQLSEELSKRNQFAIFTASEKLIGQDFNSFAVRKNAKESDSHIVCFFGQGENLGKWHAKICCHSGCEAIDQLTIVCSGLPQANGTQSVEPAAHSALQSELSGRWSRLKGAIGETADRLRSLKIMVIGAGRNGSAILQQLVMLGVGSLVIVDRDILKVENLDSMFAVHPRQIGQSKARALAESFCEYREDLYISYLEKTATHADVLQSARTADLIVTCVDNDTPRLAAATIAGRLLRPHLDIATGVTLQADGSRLIAGDVRLLMPGEGCVRCVGGLVHLKQADLELRSPPNAMRRGKPVIWHQQRMGSVLTINSMAVSVGVQLLLDLLIGTLPGSIWHRLHWIEGQGLQADSSPVGPSSLCPICNGLNT